jgi:hypothetical protein
VKSTETGATKWGKTIGAPESYAIAQWPNYAGMANLPRLVQVIISTDHSYPSVEHSPHPLRNGALVGLRVDNFSSDSRNKCSGFADLAKFAICAEGMPRCRGFIPSRLGSRQYTLLRIDFLDNPGVCCLFHGAFPPSTETRS